MNERSHCRYCDSMVEADTIIIVRDANGHVVWIGCTECYLKRKEIINA
jgi:hypothetical protein